MLFAHSPISPGELAGVAALALTILLALVVIAAKLIARGLRYLFGPRSPVEVLRLYDPSDEE